MPAQVKEEQSSEGPPALSPSQKAKHATVDRPSAANNSDEVDTSVASAMTSTNDSSTEAGTPLQTDTEELKAVDQQAEQTTPDDLQQENLQPSDASVRAEDEQIPEVEPSHAPVTTATQLLPQPSDPQPVTSDNQNRVYALPDGYRALGGDLRAGYGSLSRGSAALHGYWPSKNFQPGAHFTLPFLRDSYAPAGFSSPTGNDGLRDQSGNPVDVRNDHPAATYATLGGIHNFRPITTMELLREPSRTRSGYDDAFMAQLEGNLNPFFQAVCRAQTLQFPHKRSSMVSLDSIRRDPRWRDPNLREVISMLGHPMDPVKSNAAAYLQHLCYENERIKHEVRQLNGVPMLVDLLDHPKAEVHRKACGALRNISYGKDHNNKMAVKNCDGIQALVRLLRKTSSMEVKELVTGTLWNLSSHEPLKMTVINHGLQTLNEEIIIPHSGWRSEPGGGAEWTTVFKNTSGCLRNVSSDGAEARQRLRECEGLVDALLHALHSAVIRKDTDNKSVENCVCILRNLSYHVHKEVAGVERLQEPHVTQLMRSVAPHRKKNNDEPDCFGAKTPKEEWFSHGLKLLYQPEVVRLYLSLLGCSHNSNAVEAAAGALQNLAAGHWTWSSYIRATVRKEKGLPILVELLRSDVDKVVRAVAIALRNLAMDRRNKDLIGSYALRDLVSNLPCGQQRPAKNLEGDTVVSLLNTIHEIISDSQENARALIHGHAVQKLVAISRSSQSARETRAASHVLQTIWAYKDLRNALNKAGWNKSHFKPTATGAPKKSKSVKQSGDDITLPLMDKSQGRREGSDASSRLSAHRRISAGGRADSLHSKEFRGANMFSSSLETNDRVEDGIATVVERDAVPAISERKHFIRAGRPAVGLVDNKPPPLDSWV